MAVLKLATETDRQRLYAALASLGTPEQAAALLEDLCTLREVNEMAQRLNLARLLAEGASYAAIEEATGASATTIARVSKSLNFGPGGYRSVLEALDSSGFADEVG
ncbi:MAG: TrpR-like protein YerC/YecD [Coriobacteriales bacterium]|jgi:TrpR-related protein YerC/YecD|nr:TrpR-like protein YerC/YecD [Coriobacteriales bacterium]